MYVWVFNAHLGRIRGLAGGNMSLETSLEAWEDLHHFELAPSLPPCGSGCELSAAPAATLLLLHHRLLTLRYCETS